MDFASKMAVGEVGSGDRMTLGFASWVVAGSRVRTSVCPMGARGSSGWFGYLGPRAGGGVGGALAMGAGKLGAP